MAGNISKQLIIQMAELTYLINITQYLCDLIEHEIFDESIDLLIYSVNVRKTSWITLYMYHLQLMVGKYQIRYVYCRSCNFTENYKGSHYILSIFLQIRYMSAFVYLPIVWILFACGIYYVWIISMLWKILSFIFLYF